MKKFKIVLKIVLGGLLLVLGAMFLALWFWDYELTAFQDNVHAAVQARPYLERVWPFLGLLVMVMGVMGLISGKSRDGAVKTISYPGTHGDVIIQLDSVEANLNRVLGKMKEVRWISVTVNPDEEKGKARVSAEVRLIKGADESAAETANRVSDRLADVAANLLGVDEIKHVDMIVKGISLHGTPAETPASAHGVKHSDEPVEKSEAASKHVPEVLPFSVEAEAAAPEAAAACCSAPAGDAPLAQGCAFAEESPLVYGISAPSEPAAQDRAKPREADADRDTAEEKEADEAAKTRNSFGFHDEKET